MVRSSLVLVIALASALSAGRANAQSADTLALSLSEAVAHALRVSDEVRRAAADIAVADAQTDAARAGGLPQLRLNGTYTLLFENARAQAVGQLFNQPQTYNINANVSQSLFQGGRIIAGYRAARAVRASVRLNAQEAKTQLTLDVLRAYLDAAFASRVAEIRGGSVRLAGERLGQAERLQAAGRLARYDVLRARVERANLEPLVIAAEADRDLALLELRRLLNIPSARPIRLSTPITPETVAHLVRLAANDTVASADRASVRSAELVARARRFGVSAARAEFLPTVSIFFQSGYQAFPVSGFPPARGELQVVDCAPGAPAGQVCRRQNGGFFSDRLMGIAIGWPIFDGLRAKANLDLARAQARLADLVVALERETVEAEAAQARANVARAAALYAARRQTVEEADETFRLASLRYARGIGTTLEVSDAQQAMLIAQTDEARAAFDVYFAAATLARATGRPIPVLRGDDTPRAAPLTTSDTRE